MHSLGTDEQLKRIGERLKQLRENKGMTQEEFGKIFGLSKQSISSKEKGTSRLKQKTLVQMAEYFGVPTDYLLCLTDDPAPVSNDKINFEEYISSAPSLPDSLLRIAELDDKFGLDEPTFMRLSQLAHGLSRAKGADNAAGGIKIPNTGALDGED